MKLLVLGTAGYHPNEHRETACLMIPELGIVLDAGTGMYRVRDQLCTSSLDIFLTHAHLDHVVGLTYLLDILFQKDVQQVTVHGEQAKLDAVAQHLFSPLLFPVEPPYTARPLSPDRPQQPLPGGGSLTWFPLKHPGGSVGYRLEWPGHSMAYVTDTTASPEADYVPLIAGVDLLVHECNFADDNFEHAEVTGHSYATPVAEVARKAGVNRLLLTHLDPLATAEDSIGLDSMRQIFPNIEIARDRTTIEF